MKPPETPREQLIFAWQHLGGVSGTVLAAVPTVAFVVAEALAGMWPAIWASLGAAVVIGCVQLLRKERLTAAFAGLGGAVVAAAVAAFVGAAKGYYLWGNWITFGIGSVLLLSVLVRWPLIGAVWSAGKGAQWRRNRRSRLCYDVATLFWTVLCFARFAVQNWLYETDQTTWLGIARLAMGWPLTLVAVLVTIWAVRRAEPVKS